MNRPAMSPVPCACGQLNLLASQRCHACGRDLRTKPPGAAPDTLRSGYVLVETHYTPEEGFTSYEHPGGETRC